MKKVNTGCLVTLVGSIVMWFIFFYLSYRIWCWLWI